MAKFRSKMSEHTIQLQCIAWFRNEFERKGLGVIVPVVNEATYNNSTQVIKDGCSDTIVILGKCVIFPEFKTAVGKQRDSQIQFENEVTILGYSYRLIRSLDEFKSFVNENV